MEHRTFSLAQQVFERLENEILVGTYPRGAILTEATLSENLGVSRTPIREALGRLEQEHLVEFTGKGVRVLGVTTEDLEDIYEIRSEVERLAARKAALRATDEELNEMREVLELQEFYVQKKDADKIKSMDSRFHQLLYGACGSAVFYDVLMPLHNKVQKYRKASVQRTGRAAQSMAEHRAIFEALLAHDEAAADAAVAKHIENAKASVLKGE